MILWDKVKRSFDSGVDVLRRIAVAVSERASIESDVARRLIDKGSLETKLNRQYRTLGERVYQLWEQGEEEIMEDRHVRDALNDVAAASEQLADMNLKIRKASLGERVD